MVAEQLTVIGGDQHQCVLVQAAFIQDLENPADGVVELTHHAVVARRHRRQFPAGE